MNHRLVATKTKISNEFFPEHTRIPKEPQKILNCQDNLEKKREREREIAGTTWTDFRIYSKVAVIKTVWHRHTDIKDGHIDSLGTKESHQISL